MDIAIVGAGNVGRALATSLTRPGHTWHTGWKLIGVPAGVVDREQAAA